MTDDRRPAADPESRARTHLANERTYLAWFRTGFALSALGLAAAQFLGDDSTMSFPIVALLSTLAIVTGLFVVLVGAARYVAGRERIDALDFRPAGTSIVVATVAAIVFTVLGLIFVWTLTGS
jgi:putative membrane protein